MSPLPPARYSSALDSYADTPVRAHAPGPVRRAGSLAARRWLSRTPPARLIGLMTGGWLTLYCVTDFALRPRNIDWAKTLDVYRVASPALSRGLLAVLLLGCVPMILAAVWTGVDFRRVKSLFNVSLLVCLSIVLSYFGSLDLTGIERVVMVAVLLGYLIIGASANLDADEFLKGVALGVVVSETAMLTVVLLNHDVQWGRLYGHNTPNYWGMAAQATIIACVAIRNRPLQVVALAISLITIVWCQSRGSMMATTVGLTTVLVLLTLTKRLSAWVLLIGPALLLSVGIFGMTYVSEKLLRLSDPTRGAESGFSGRVRVWHETLDLFSSHPLFGVGYRNHEQYLTSAVSAHNAYLATLADVGLFGAVVYLVLIVGGVVIGWSKALRSPTPGRLMAAALMSAYLANGMFERNALNTGNFYSVLVMLMCAWTWRSDFVGIPRIKPLARSRLGPIADPVGARRPGAP